MNFSIIESVTSYLVDKTGSSLGYHQEKMPKAKQVELFGMYFGKGTICIFSKLHIIKSYPQTTPKATQ